IGEVGFGEWTVTVLGLDALMKQFEVDLPRLDGDAEEELALSEPIAAALDGALQEPEARADVSEKEAGGDLIRLAAGDQRIGAAVTFVNKRPKRARNLRVRLFHQPV